MSMKRKASGFTLIELLVVISIIAVLISILLPALSSAVQTARRIRGQANMRDVAQTAQTYASDDPKGILGPVHPEAIRFIGDGYAEYGGGPGTMPYGGWGQEFDPRTRAFNKIIYGPRAIVANTVPGDTGVFQVFQCPGEDFGWQEWPGFNTNPLETETPYFKGNGAAFRMNNLAFEDGTSVGIYGRAINKIPDPAQTLAFMEARVYQTLWTNNVWGILDHGELTSWHRKLGFFNVAYSDGHGTFADFGDDTYYQHDVRYNETDARGSWGRMDCNPEPQILD
jgi:prepilin-type N-terminal cleavage/methylation domain-containing protein